MILSRIPAISRQGISGSLLQNSSERFLAASPIISSERSTAFDVFKSDTNSSKDVSETNCSIASISSRICNTYVLSLSIKHREVTYDSRLHVFTDAAFGYDIDFSLENVFQSILQTNQVQKGKGPLVFYQYV